jgi:DNA-binding NtrC family response regulator
MQFKTLAELEQDHIRLVLSHHIGNVSRAARALGIDRRTLYRKARELGLKSKPNPTSEAELRARIRELEGKLSEGT